MKLSEKAIAAGLIIAILCTFTGFGQTKKEISDGVLRLHILANSDSDADQQLKLTVRDRLLSEAGDIFTGAKDRAGAAEAAEKNLDRLTAIAKDELMRQGSDYDVRCEVTDMYFDIREYEDISMPSGEYTALRVTIGEGKGKNWWCVMFPPLCLPAAEETTECFNEEEQDVLSVKEPEYEVKFKIVEIIEEIGNAISGAE